MATLKNQGKYKNRVGSAPSIPTLSSVPGPGSAEIPSNKTFNSKPSNYKPPTNKPPNNKPQNNKPQNCKLPSISMGPYNCEELSAALKQLQLLIKCKACHSPMRSVRTCLNGHGVCWNCKNRCSGYCPLCRTQILNNKPELLNEIVQLLPRTCGFMTRGCDSLVLSNDNEHETYCRFRDTFCRIPTCGWKGMAKDLLLHLEKFHGRDVIRTETQTSILMGFNTTNDREGLAVIVAFNNIFWQHTRMRQNLMMQFYQYVPMERPKYRFSVFVKYHTPEVSFGKNTPVHTDIFDPKQLFHDKETFCLPKKVADSFNKFHSGVHYSFTITSKVM